MMMKKELLLLLLSLLHPSFGITKTYYTQDQNADNNIRGASPAGKQSSWVADYGGYGSWVEWDVETPVCAEYTLTARYQAKKRPVNVYVDGMLEAELLTVGYSWRTWKTVSMNVELGCGNNIASQLIRLVADNSSGPNLDTLTVTYEIPLTSAPTTGAPTSSAAPTQSLAPSTAPTQWTKGDPIEGGYNLILTDLRCWDTTMSWPADNCCPNLSLGIQLPSDEERFQMMQANIARMFPSEYRNTIYAPNNFNFASGGSCGIVAEKPYHMSHDGMEHGRYYAKSLVTCEEQPPPHKTCEEDCGLFGEECLRTKAFRSGSNGYINAEALGGNLPAIFTSYAHCSLIFKEDRNFFSIGTTPGQGLVINGWRSLVDANKRYALPMASHFSRKLQSRRAGAVDGLIFHTVYYNPENPSVHGYVLYQGERHEMSILHGNATRGIFEYETDLVNDCEPYYFHFDLEDGESIRLPEDPRFMFATSGIGSCTENHYFDIDGLGTFKADAGPNFPGVETCVGCGYISSIDYKDGEIPLNR